MSYEYHQTISFITSLRLIISDVAQLGIIRTIYIKKFKYLFQFIFSLK